jgi:hypothetical protein
MQGEMMDGDELLQYLGWGLGGVLAVMVLAAIVGRVGAWLCRRVGLPAWPGALAGALVPLAVLVAGSLYLDQAGVVVPARVLSKEERIVSARNRAPDNWWTRQLQMTVEFATADGRPTTTQVLADEERFDALRPGAAVMVRYLPEVRLIARLADQSTLSLIVVAHGRPGHRRARRDLAAGPAARTAAADSDRGHRRPVRAADVPVPALGTRTNRATANNDGRGAQCSHDHAQRVWRQPSP